MMLTLICNAAIRLTRLSAEGKDAEAGSTAAF